MGRWVSLVSVEVELGGVPAHTPGCTYWIGPVGGA